MNITTQEIQDKDIRRKLFEKDIQKYIANTEKVYRFKPLFYWYDQDDSTFLTVNNGFAVCKINIKFSYFFNQKPFRMIVNYEDFRREPTQTGSISFYRNEPFDVHLVSDCIIGYLKLGIL